MRFYDGIANENDYYDFLMLFSKFNYEQTIDGYKFEYENQNDTNLRSLLLKYDYINAVNSENQFKTLINLMIWVFEKLIGDGMCRPIRPLNAECVLDQTFAEGIKSNCYTYAVVLNEIYLSLGLYSRMVRCMPTDICYSDCHCVTEVYSCEYNKWIVMDSANKAYYVNNKMIPLNLFEMRSCILNKEDIYIPMMGRMKSKSLVQYFTKNIIRFESYKKSCYNSENLTGERTMYHFQSSNYPISDKTVDFDEFLLRHIHTCNPNIFWAKPDHYQSDIFNKSKN